MAIPLFVRHLYQRYKEHKVSYQQTDVLPASQSSQPIVSDFPELHTAATTTVAENRCLENSGRQNITSNWRWRLTLMAGLFIPIFLETLDYTVVATAQPHIASVFRRLELQSYIGTSYLLSSTVFLPVFSSLADVYGRHNALQLSLVFFLVGSAISTGAVTMYMMLLGRGIAGIGAAGLLTVVSTILLDAGSLDDNSWQQSIMFILYAAGYSIGPTIGGYLVAVSFRWIFAINLPCCVIAMALAFFLLRNRIKASQPSQRHPISSSGPATDTTIQKFLRMDWIGAFIFIAGGISLLLGLNWGSTTGWNTARVIVSLLIGAILMLLFILWQYILGRQLSSPAPPTSSIFSADPMIPLEVFGSYDICAVQYMTFVSGMVMLVMFYFISIFMTIVNGLSPGKAGVQLIYFAPGMGAGAFIAIYAIKFFRQPRYPILLGSVITVISIGFIQMAMRDNKQYFVNGLMVVAGVGIGLGLAPLAIQARLSQADNRVAVVAGLSLFSRFLGGTVGLAQCGAVLTSKVKSFLISAAESGTLPLSSVAALSNINSDASSLQAISALPEDLQVLVRNAFRSGTRWAFISLIPWCGVNVLLTVLLSKIPDRAPEVTDNGGGDNEGEKVGSRS